MYIDKLMFVSMDIINAINVNNNSSCHFECSENIGDAAPSMGKEENISSGNFENENLAVDGERHGRKRKTRRFKSRFKGKSVRKSKYLKKMTARIYPQSEAPYNTNQFLMADHNNVENLDDKLAVPKVERMRVRDPSFTSADSDDDQFYSSPEDEDEFLTKDFDDTYQSMCAEKLASLSKSQLTKIILELEAKVETLTKGAKTNSTLDQVSNMLKRVNGVDNQELQIEIKDIMRENDRLRNENEQLKHFIEEHAVTSSSTSSSSSDSASDSSSDESKTDRPTV